MSGDDPKTLLEHPVRVVGRQGVAKARPPEKMLEFANRVLQQLSIVDRKDVLGALQDSGNPGFHAAWLQRHAVKVIDILRNASPETKTQLRDVWIQAFFAGARHESIRADDLYLPTVRGQRGRTRRLPKAREKSADKRRRFSDKKLQALQRAGLSKAGQAKALGVSRQAIYKRERARNKRQPV